MSVSEVPATPRRTMCSFCGASSEDRDVMFSSALPDVFICDLCVATAGLKLIERREAKGESKPA